MSKAENILVAVAWPYASADIHVGNITGSYLPADIFARYQRLKGNNVIMVSGSDSHGTPITVKSDAEGTTPEKLYQRYHANFLELFQKLGLNYDLFTSHDLIPPEITVDQDCQGHTQQAQHDGDSVLHLDNLPCCW